MKTAYGLDLAGYSAGKSSLATANFDESAGYEVVVFLSHAFAEKREGRDPLADQAERERSILRACSPVFIDVPIDLQQLSVSREVYFVWQLTKRPVNYAFGALPPLADRLGSPVARLAYLLEGNQERLGSDVFETYPAASLIPLIGIVASYKGQKAERQCGRWIGDDGLADILTRMRVEAEDGVRLNDDHFDAAICALTGVLPDGRLLQGDQLESDIRHRLERKVRVQNRGAIVAEAPKGYVLIREPLSGVRIRLRIEERFP